MISRNEFLKMGMALPLALQSLGQRAEARAIIGTEGAGPAAGESLRSTEGTVRAAASQLQQRAAVHVGRIRRRLSGRAAWRRRYCRKGLEANAIG